MHVLDVDVDVDVVDVDVVDVVDVGDVVDGGDVIDEFRGLRGYQRDEAFMGVEREIRRLQAMQYDMLAEVKQSLSFVDDGHHSPATWVAAVTNCSRGGAHRRVHTAALLHDLPVLALAVRAGEVGGDQLQLVMKLWLNPRCREHLGAAQDLLVGHARSLTLREFAQICERFQAHTDPDGNHRDHELSRQNRSISQSAIGAGHILHAEGDALSGEVLSKILDDHATAEYEIDVADLHATYGDDAKQYQLARTATQRRYDALVAIFLKASGANGTARVTPLVNIITNEHTLNQIVGNYYANPDAHAAAEPPTSDHMWLCQTATGAPVAAADLLVAALIGQIRRVVVDSAGRVVDLGRRSRLFTGAAREAVLLAGDRCCWPGCGRHGPQIDHLNPWARAGGVTSPLNGAPLCGRHNRYKHLAGTTTSRRADGWHHHRLDDTEIAPRFGGAAQ